jgi:hypothetical protein
MTSRSAGCSNARQSSRPRTTVCAGRTGSHRSAQGIHLVAGHWGRRRLSIARPVASAPSIRLIAAFNGGFKAVNGAFGMAVNGNAVAAAEWAGHARLYRDGSVRLGVWGTDIQQTPDLVAFRQNCRCWLIMGR